MTDSDDRITFRMVDPDDASREPAEEAFGTGGEFSGVVIPTAEGRRHGLPGIDLLKKEVRDQSVVMKKDSLDRIREKRLSEGEQSFLDRVAAVEHEF